MPGHCELEKVREGNAARGAHDAISPGSCRVGVHRPHSPRGRPLVPRPGHRGFGSTRILGFHILRPKIFEKEKNIPES